MVVDKFAEEFYKLEAAPTLDCDDFVYLFRLHLVYLPALRVTLESLRPLGPGIICLHDAQEVEVHSSSDISVSFGVISHRRPPSKSNAFAYPLCVRRNGQGPARWIQVRRTPEY